MSGATELPSKFRQNSWEKSAKQEHKVRHRKQKVEQIDASGPLKVKPKGLHATMSAYPEITPLPRCELHTNDIVQKLIYGPVDERSGAEAVLVAFTRLAEEDQLVHLARANQSSRAHTVRRRVVGAQSVADL